MKSEDSTLRLVRMAEGRFGLQVDAHAVRFEQKTPLALEVVDAGGVAHWIYGGYTRVTSKDGAFNGEGELLSPKGTRFRFFDRFTRDGDGFQLQRRVEITSPASNDAGFATRFGLAWTTPITTRDCDVLMPGAWYRDNQTVPPAAFAANIDHQVLLYREDRLGLPLVAARDRKSGISLVLERVGGDPTTFAGENGKARLIDERLQVGALGLLNASHLEAVFSFPGTEDDRPTFGPDSPGGPRFMPRSHPVKIGVAHAYTLHFGASKTEGFAALVESVTKAAITRAQPALVPADLQRVYRASMDLLDTVIQSHNGTVSVPFQVVVPHGEIKDTSMQMGFVGMALPCAALLLKDGLETKNQSAVERAVKVVDFWVQQSPEPSGVPKNWADFPAPGKVTWRGFPTHLRVASDGMRGVLRAWNVARRHGMDKPQWLQYARRFGDFLVKKQNADGSWFGSWSFDGTPRDRFTNASLHPLAFLVDLSRATSDPQYQQAALRAGEFCWRTVHQAYSYVGGTPDNPNVTDKEAGVIAVDGFLALFDATDDRKWLDAARQAAIFCETWIYWRDLPLPPHDPKQVFPRARNTVGLSLISTGHAGADNFMAIAPFLWYRIYLMTGDQHFLQSARLLLNNTKQVMDWDGKLGYQYAGLMPEAMSLSTNRGHGVAGWLPWLTFVVLEPLVRLNETFGSMDIDHIERLPQGERLRRNALFSRERGFGPQ
ncbi:MAG: hypothetical protein M3347_00350 [Armatimonadota bacterium]|nr:hypothetical protein [Armatimonadota bacterium]